jgi:predicted ATP-grasp superfamily ATP-dependent carboligase
MILGPRDDGRADRVLEVNPRLTTSFVGLAAAAPRSLVRTMLDLAAGGRMNDGAA